MAKHFGRDEHLNSEDFEGLMAGRGSESAMRHARGCAMCAGELASVGTLMAGVRASAMEAGERQRLLAVVPETAGGGRARGWLRGGVWAGAMAAVLVAAAIPVEMMPRDRAPAVATVSSPQPGQGATELSDEALLNGVQNDLSSTVPGPLEPLTATTIAGTTTATTITNSNSGNTKE